MSPPAVAERVAPAVELYSFVRDHLNERERQRFHVEFAAAGGETGVMKELLTSWYLTVSMRQHPSYAAQLETFLQVVRSGDVFGSAQAL
jgi:hypothetical protein